MSKKLDRSGCVLYTLIVLNETTTQTEEREAMTNYEAAQAALTAACDRNADVAEVAALLAECARLANRMVA